MIKDRDVKKAIEIVIHEFQELEAAYAQNEEELAAAQEQIQGLKNENQELKEYIAEIGRAHV